MVCSQRLDQKGSTVYTCQLVDVGDPGHASARNHTGKSSAGLVAWSMDVGCMLSSFCTVRSRQVGLVVQRDHFRYRRGNLCICLAGTRCTSRSSSWDRRNEHCRCSKHDRPLAESYPRHLAGLGFHLGSMLLHATWIRLEFQRDHSCRNQYVLQRNSSGSGTLQETITSLRQLVLSDFAIELGARSNPKLLPNRNIRHLIRLMINRS